MSQPQHLGEDFQSAAIQAAKSFEVDSINLVLYQKIPFFLGFIFMTDTKKLMFLDNFIFNAYPYKMLKEAFFQDIYLLF